MLNSIMAGAFDEHVHMCMVTKIETESDFVGEPVAIISYWYHGGGYNMCICWNHFLRYCFLDKLRYAVLVCV